MDVFFSSQFDALYAAHPLVLVDVGARGGLKHDWAAARRHLRVIGFEPDAQEFERLQARATAQDRDRVLGVALGDRRGSVTLHVTEDRGLSSLFEPNRPFLDQFPDADRFDVVDVRTVAVDRLDDVLRANGIADVDFLKVDTQGSELLILQGAADTLAQSVVGVEVEVEFSPIYAHQPLFADVDTFMRAHGFQLFDLRPCYWKRTVGRDLGGPYGQIIWADALYLKTEEALATLLAPLSDEGRRAKLCKALSIAVLYGYRDYAMALVQGLGSGLTHEERSTLERLLATDRSGGAPLPRFPGKAAFAAVARRIAALLADTNGGWSVGEGRTGNHK